MPEPSTTSLATSSQTAATTLRGRSLAMWVVMGAIASILVLLVYGTLQFGFFPPIIPFMAAFAALLGVLIWRPRPWLYLVGGIVSLALLLLLNTAILTILLKPVGDPLTFIGMVVIAAGPAGFVGGVFAFREARRGTWTPAALGPPSEWAVAALVGLLIGASYVSIVGSSSGGAGVPNGVTEAPTQAALVLTAENIKFVEHSLQGKSGVISLYVVNKDSSFHTFDITVDGKHYSYPLASKSTTGVVLKLGSAKYTYWCAVGDHRQNGMEGTITTS